ncbi:MAG: helix-turn-helix transcriptional regulator [Gemmatimonadales bacterium]|nr:helix-turn-helix transcriptional regulator [Gemmatimonadales bacterium]MYG50279.1 helix-turn-helix transcriptional regulator [Gemmatimonadales bacterium]MYK01125.1 helix-turn-helix transcriptional regulator [Candidatus Palauibacter ramosifaciens]
MSSEDLFERTLASMHRAALDDSEWLSAAALINESVSAVGHALVLTRGHSLDGEIFFMRFCYGGRRREDFEHTFIHDYLDRDERVPRITRLPDGQLVHTPELFTEVERKRSPVYNELLGDMEAQRGLNVRLDGPAGSDVIWTLADCADKDGWSSDHLAMFKRLRPHIRHLVSVRHALVEADALGTSLHGLLENARTCVMELDRRGKIVAANDLARDILRQRDGLFAPGGFLRATRVEENSGLQRLVARAIPPFRGQGVGGSAIVGGSSPSSRWIVHVQPVEPGLRDSRMRRVAALVLAVRPASPVWIDPGLVALALGLTVTESRLASMLAAGKCVREIAAETGRKKATVHWHLDRIFRKLGIARQAELVRRVLSLQTLNERPRPAGSTDESPSD